MMLHLVNDSHSSDDRAALLDSIPGRSWPSDHEQLRELAQRLAEVLPAPGPALADDALGQELLGQAIVEVADLLITAAHEDIRVLVRAIGPRIEVGANPVWRMMLEVALGRCSAPQSLSKDTLSA